MACRMKAEALREDENVFDVAFEGMGTDEPTASATDVKVKQLDPVMTCLIDARA